MTTQQTKPLTFIFQDDGAVPNNPRLPVLVYKSAVDLGRGITPPAAVEALFTANGWGRDLWRDSIYPFVHYHAMIHEALGIARGFARVQLGGEGGRTFELKAGDVVVLPAGTAHQRLICNENFQVVGGYPPDGTYDLCRGDNAADRTRALATIAEVPLPQTDPVAGAGGPLPMLWRR